jgi:cytoskeleton protein RodZ
MPEIGATLREARMRARIDVSEIEASTKIRAKYLRALENEEWSLLPGPTFVKSFLRTYAQALGLDGRSLVEEYRLHHERPSEAMMEPIVSPPQRSSGRVPGRGSGGGPSRGYVAAVSVVGALIVLLIVLLATGGGSSHKKGKQHGGTTARHTGTSGKRAASPGSGTSSATASSTVTLSITPTAVVYVCLLGDNGHKLIPGVNLQPGETTSTYHAKRFELTLGNNAVTLNIDGRPRTVPASSQAIGYAITKARGRQTLTGSQLPTCQ